jgi:hypothetical protein
MPARRASANATQAAWPGAAASACSARWIQAPLRGASYSVQRVLPPGPADAATNATVSPLNQPSTSSTPFGGASPRQFDAYGARA